MFTIICDRCGTELTGYDERDAEAKFSAHECEGMRSLDDLPFEYLREIAYGRMTEAHAWELVDNANAEANAHYEMLHDA